MNFLRVKHIIKSFANFVRNDFFCLQRSYRSAFKNHDFDDYNISGTITTTKTSFVPLASVTLAIDESENRTRISLTVSEIFELEEQNRLKRLKNVV